MKLMMRTRRYLVRTLVTMSLAAGGISVPSAFVPVRSAYAQDGWDVQGGDKRRQEIVRRYKLLLENNPTEGMFFNKLLEETGKGAGLDRLIEEYQAKAKAKPDTTKYWLILGHLLKAKARYQEAFEAYDKAIALDPKNPLGYLGRGSTGMMVGKNQEAGADFEKALSMESDRNKKQEILRKLADIAFAQRDWDNAQRYYDQLIELDPRNEYLRMEYAQVLIKYKRYDKALEQYEALVKLAGGNVKARATTLRDLGELYERMGDDEKALQTYAKAQSYVRSDNWLYREVEQRVIGVYRRLDRLEEYVEQKSKQWRSPSFDQAMMLASIYDELGKEDEALKHYELARRKSPRSVDPRVKIIQVLQRRGQNKDVIKAYEELIRVDGSQSRYQFELAKLHQRNGDNKKAEAVLTSIQRRFRRDPDVMVTLADTYMRVGLKEEALKVYKDLVSAYPKNDSFIISLGEYYYQAGEVDRAITTWRKVLSSNLSKSEANARLGQVMVDHNMVDKGISYLEKAVEQAPKERETLRALAAAYESGRRWSEAVATWERILALSDQPQSASEARGRILSLYQRQNRLRPMMREFEQRFAATPPDLEAGYFLADGHLKLGEKEKAEAVFKRIINIDGKVDAEDVNALTELEKLYAQQGKPKDAIDVLQKLAELRPLRAKEYYYRIAELSLRTFDDAQAVRYAQLALEKNPEDAAAHARLGEVYAKMQREADAIKEYRQAIDLDPRAFEHYLALASLLMDQGDAAGAKTLYTNVAVKAMDEQLIMMAGRKAMSLSPTTADLEQLEGELGPMVFRSPPKPVYRKLMLEIYGRLLSGFVAQRHYGLEPQPKAARARQDQIANRAFPVLMDSLTGDDVGLRQQASKMLGELQLGNAALALGRMVDDPREPLRVQAAIAVARIGDARAAEPLLRASAETEPVLVRSAALWALGSCGDKSAVKPLGLILEQGAQGQLQVLAAIALGRIGHKDALPYLRKAAERASLNRYSDQTSTATLWALGALRDEASVARFKDALERGSEASQQAAAYALGRLSSEGALGVLLDGYWGDDEGRREIARRALLQMAQGLGREAEDDLALLRQINRESRFVDERGQYVNVNGIVELLREQLAYAPMSDVSELLLKYDGQIQEAIKRVLSAAQAQPQRQLLRDLGDEAQALNLGRAGSQQDKLKVAHQRWLKSVHSQLIDEVRSGDPERQMLAIGLLGELADAKDLPVVLEAAGASSSLVRHQALLSLGEGFVTQPSAQDALIKGLKDQDYMVRVAAAKALGQGKPLVAAREGLVALLKDSFPSAQNAAIETLGRWSDADSVTALEAALEDADLSLQAVILRALVQIDSPQARKIVEPYQGSEHLLLRRALTPQ